MSFFFFHVFVFSCLLIYISTEGLFFFQVCRSDGLPDTMCMKCVSKLDQIKEFRDQCKRSDDVLRQYLEAKQVDVS